MAPRFSNNRAFLCSFGPDSDNLLSTGPTTVLQIFTIPLSLRRFLFFQVTSIKYPDIRRRSFSVFLLSRRSFGHSAVSIR